MVPVLALALTLACALAPALASVFPVVLAMALALALLFGSYYYCQGKSRHALADRREIVVLPAKAYEVLVLVFPLLDPEV